MNQPNNSLLDKVVVITGARRGVGKAISLAFAKAQANVAICDVVDDGELSAVAEEIRSLGRRALAIAVDITHKAEVDDAVQKVIDEFGRVDILVNNAGIFDGAPLLELKETIWDRVMDTNLKGYYLCCQAVGKRMVIQKNGNIINMASRNAFKGDENKGPYCISKAAVVMLTRVLARELGKYNIRVNAIAPGVINLEHTQFMWNDPEYKKMYVDSVPIGRFADPNEIANIALFLASDASSFITGHAILADGGRQA